MNLKRLDLIIRHFGYSARVSDLPRFYDLGTDFGFIFSRERNDWLNDMALALGACFQIQGGMRWPQTLPLPQDSMRLVNADGFGKN